MQHRVRPLTMEIHGVSHQEGVRKALFSCSLVTHIGDSVRKQEFTLYWVLSQRGTISQMDTSINPIYGMTTLNER